VSATTATAAPTTTPIAPGRLKGKARKEAKKTQEQQEQQPRASQSGSEILRKYRVSTAEILRQADFFKSLGEPLVMSKTIWGAFREAIRGRQQYTEKFAKEEPDHKGNAGHVYLLDVLRQLFDILGEIVRLEGSSPGHTELSSGDGFLMYNMFEILASEQPDEDEVDQAELPADDVPKTGKTVEVPSAHYEPNIDPTEEERRRWFSFIDDSEVISGWIIDLWKEYFKGQQSAQALTTITLLSELAVEMIFKLEDELRDMFKIWVRSHESHLSRPDIGEELCVRFVILRVL
jgi:hypothetical protein